MFRRMEEDMDINADTTADGEETHEQVADRIYQEVLRVASGGQSKSEALGFGDCEFVPWNISARMRRSKEVSGADRAARSAPTWYS